MQRYVTRLRNIGIMGGIDAGSATCRERIVELTSDERPVSGTFGEGGRVRPQVGTWTPRSGPFADEATSVSIVEGRPHMLDGAVVVLDGARGDAETAEAALREMYVRGVPCIAFIDDVSAAQDLEAMVDSIFSDLGVTAVPVHLPYNDELGSHLIDLLEQRLVLERENGDRELRPVPAAVQQVVDRLRRRIVDVCAELDDSILGASTTGLDVGGDELARALREATIARDSRVLVVTCGSLRARRGVGPLLDAIVTYLPSPAERHPSAVWSVARGLERSASATEGLRRSRG